MIRSKPFFLDLCYSLKISGFMSHDNPNRNDDAEDLIPRFLLYIVESLNIAHCQNWSTERFPRDDGEAHSWEEQEIEIPATQVARRICSGRVGFACVRSWKNTYLLRKRVCV